MPKEHCALTSPRIFAIAALAFGHAALSMTLFLGSFGRGMARFDTGEPATTGARLLDVVAEILLWPLFAPLADWGGPWTNSVFAGLLGYVPLLLNSVIWAFAIVFAWRLMRRHRADDGFREPG